jgi:exosortase A-associated hydrolase 1
MTSEAVYPLLIPCEGEELVGIVHRGAAEQQRAIVVIVAGGPQYRVGAHRQFVSLANLLAAEGYTVLRFDLRGMGDSSGRHLGFEKSGEDIRRAIDRLLETEPGLSEVVLYGECESASGALFYAYKDARVKGLILVNPWVRTPEVRAQVFMRHYYFQRLFAPALWRKVIRGEFRPVHSLLSFGQLLRRSVQGWYLALQPKWANGTNRTNGGKEDEMEGMPLPARTAAGFQRFNGEKLVIVSGNDYIAKEFDLVVNISPNWKGLMSADGVKRVDIPGADHSFSDPASKQRVQHAVLQWMDAQTDLKT